MIRYDILQILPPKKGTNCWKMLDIILYRLGTKT